MKMDKCSCDVILDSRLSWLIAFLAQLNPLEAPVMDTLVAGHIRKVWASSHGRNHLHVHLISHSQPSHFIRARIKCTMDPAMTLC